MTRIIAGEFGGRRLKVPDDGTRPTSDRVREAVFSVLGARIEFDDARVLDLYAGSGALAIEAVSRGAASAVLVDSRSRATSVVAANLRSLGIAGRTRVVTAPVASFLSEAGARDAESAGFDLVFSDPPYALETDEVEADLRRLASAWLADDAVVVVERDVRSTPPTWPEVFDVIVEKVYGETRVQVGRFTP
ncbi:16S rRNA (guanine(966)-N(2))-methyltransferase RsmD [Gordonia aichiensis]|uniref:Methyltransferase n=1 Tax=Gordonia aichiensis NBRC 108223 TaxID=1220583 RepID=L7KPA0_9ACTN|nr:16S rRNA (guanine(966)-N(2))-methyltransferase RsmD [Gordonia aichiensis]GAC49787.1 hypothetical protein GOACH_17_00400 [Gordonia aichiensis NBRC 108223]